MTERIPIIENATTSIETTENTTVAKPKNFNQLLLNAIDEALIHLFNETAAKSIYTYMDSMCNLKRKDIAEKTDIFSTSLERLLGSGALVIENLILKILCSKLGLEFTEREGYRFSDYAIKLRKAYECT